LASHGAPCKFGDCNEERVIQAGLFKAARYNLTVF